MKQIHVVISIVSISIFINIIYYYFQYKYVNKINMKYNKNYKLLCFWRNNIFKYDDEEAVELNIYCNKCYAIYFVCLLVFAFFIPASVYSLYLNGWKF